MIASNNHSTQARRPPWRLIPDQYVFPHSCALEAARTQGRFSLFQGIESRHVAPSEAAWAILSRAQDSDRIIDLAFKFQRLLMLRIEF